MVLTAMAAAALGATRATGSGTVAAAAVQEVWRMVQEEREEAWLLGGGEATAAGGAWVGEATSVEVGWTHSRATLAAEVCQVEADTSTGGHGGEEVDMLVKVGQLRAANAALKRALAPGGVHGEVSSSDVNVTATSVEVRPIGSKADVSPAAVVRLVESDATAGGKVEADAGAAPKLAWPMRLPRAERRPIFKMAFLKWRLRDGARWALTPTMWEKSRRRKVESGGLRGISRFVEVLRPRVLRPKLPPVHDPRARALAGWWLVGWWTKKSMAEMARICTRERQFRADVVPLLLGPFRLRRRRGL